MGNQTMTGNLLPARRATCVLAGLAAWATLGLIGPSFAAADDWPRWRGPRGNGVSDEQGLPVTWSATENVRWRTEIPGHGSSSPIVCGGRVYVTSAFDGGARRALLCLDRERGNLHWTCEVEDDWPEITSSLTGHAAATAATDGKHLVAFFGNAGAIGCDTEGRLLWRKDLGDFESELGFASSPVIHQGWVFLLCDHDGDRFRSFDSYLIALDVKTGETRWKTNRKELYRSWSTPIVVPVENDRARDKTHGANRLRPAEELVVAGQDALRGYDPTTGEELWRVDGLTAWVAPSPVFGRGFIFAASGKDGPTLAVRPGGRGDVTETHVVWSERRGAPYVSSPLLYGDYLYVANELGVVTCRRMATGEIAWQRRLEGKFLASPVAADGKVYLAAESGTMYVLAAGPAFRVLTENTLGEDILASPAIADGCLFVRTQRHLYCLRATAAD